MTRGSLADKILLFALPVALTAILQQFYNTVDVAVTGRFMGTDAMAAVGTNSSVISLLVSLFQGISLGANVTIATAIGAGEKDRAHKAVHTAILVALAGGVLFALVAEALSRPFLVILEVPAEVMDGALAYLRIYLAGLPVVFLYDFEAAILRSIGDSRKPLYALVVSCMVNLVLDLLSCAVLGWGVAGVAAATVVATAVAALILLFDLLTTTTDVRVSLSDLRLDPWSLGRTIRIGLPAGLQASFFSVANIVIQGAINSLGSVAIAASSASVSLEVITYYSICAFGQACTTFVGQNNGARSPDRCRRTLRLVALETTLIDGALIILVLVFGRQLLAIFNPDPEVVGEGYVRLCNVVGAHVFTIVAEVLSGYLRGYGVSLSPAVMTLMSIVLIRLAYVFVLFPGNPSFDFLMRVYPITLAMNALGIGLLFLFLRRNLGRQD